jgi:hypothetical protein
MKNGMPEDIDSILDINGNAVTAEDAVPASRLSTAAAGLGGIAVLSGCLPVACEPIPKGEWYIFNYPGWVGWAIVAAVFFGLLALLLAISGLVRIACSHGALRGYRRCLAGILLAFVGNIAWIVIMLCVL